MTREEIEDFYYYKDELIGHGAFAIVYKGRYKKKDVDVAVKAITKKNLNKARNLLTKEIRILKDLSGLKHENLVSLLKCVETPTYVYLIMEFCNGGDLADYLQKNTTLTEATIQHFFKQISHGLRAMHSKDIVHRDLKPQNILLCRPVDRPHPLPTEYTVKLADFGFARVLSEGVMAGTLCGSPMYMAPEVIMSHQYDAKADLWSIGTIIYQCLVGTAPFVEKTPQALKTFYEKNRDLRPKIPDSCSAPLKDLLYRLLKRNAKDRIEFEDFFSHSFLNSPLPTPSQAIGRRIESTQQKYYASSRTPIAPSSVPASNAYGYTMKTTPQKLTAEPIRHSPRPTTLSRNLSHGDSRGYVAPLASLASPPKNMSDSNEFTFLPPLRSNNMSSKPLSQQQQQHIQYSNGSTAVENPVKQVQVHSSNSNNVRAVPVPSQRTNFTIMEQRRNSSKSPLTPSQKTPEKPLHNYVPNIENITVPETKYILRETVTLNPNISPKNRRSTINDLVGCIKEEESETPKNISPIRETTPQGPSSTVIPKSATFTLPLSEGIIPQEKEQLQLNPPVDNIQYLSTSPSRTTAAATVKIISPSHKPNVFPSFSSDEEDDENETSYTGNAGSSDSQMMESASGNETGTTTSSGVYSAAAKAKSQNDINNTKSPNSEINNIRPIFGVEPHTELDPETLLEGEHHKILNKLQFISEFIETLVSVADNITNPIAGIVEGSRRSNNEASDGCRRSEQIVLYVRAMYILTSALNFSEQQINERKLHPSQKVKHVLNQLNDKYHYCLTRSQELASLGIAGGTSPTTSIISAEKIMYRHALDLCQSAALDELFGNPHLCPKRYQTAYMMLHTLSEQVQNEQDRSILARYKSAVEKRLRILEQKGLVTVVNN